MKKNDDKNNKLRKAIYDDKHEKRNAKLQKIVVEEKDRMQKVREKIVKYYQEIKHFKKSKQEKEKMIMDDLAKYYDAANGAKAEWLQE